MIRQSDLDKVAGLARLRLGREEVEHLTQDCQAILEHFEAISEVDTGGARPEGDLDQTAPLRVDRPNGDRLLVRPGEFAPDWREDYFVLPRLPAMDDPVDGSAET